MSDLLRKLELEAAYDKIELEAIITIKELGNVILQLDFTRFASRADHLAAKKPLQDKQKVCAKTISEIDEKRLMIGLMPSYAFVYASAQQVPLLSSAPAPLSPSLFLSSMSLPIDNGPVRVVEPIELSFDEEKEVDDTPKKLKRKSTKRKQELVSEDEETEESFTEESSDGSSSEEFDDDGIVADDQPIKVYSPTDEDASEKEVMNFDARTLGKCNKNGEFEELKTRKDGNYKLRNVKPRITEVDKMLEAALKGDLSHIKRWFEAKVFQDKNLMVFGAYQTDKANDAYQELLELARRGVLKPPEGTLPTRKARCQLCQTVKPTNHGLRHGKKVFRVGEDCWNKFNLVFTCMRFIKWVSKGESDNKSLKKAIKKFQKIEEEIENFFY